MPSLGACEWVAHYLNAPTARTDPIEQHHTLRWQGLHKERAHDHPVGSLVWTMVDEKG